ncbi:E3 ubiquitin/ISG15 ligase TRIM25, partial [Frankliniella fusca]
MKGEHAEAAALGPGPGPGRSGARCHCWVDRERIRWRARCAGRVVPILHTSFQLRDLYFFRVPNLARISQPAPASDQASTGFSATITAISRLSSPARRRPRPNSSEGSTAAAEASAVSSDTTVPDTTVSAAPSSTSHKYERRSTASTSDGAASVTTVSASVGTAGGHLLQRSEEARPRQANEANDSNTARSENASKTNQNFASKKKHVAFQTNDWAPPDRMTGQWEVEARKDDRGGEKQKEKFLRKSKRTLPEAQGQWIKRIKVLALGTSMPSVKSPSMVPLVTLPRLMATCTRPPSRSTTNTSSVAHTPMSTPSARTTAPDRARHAAGSQPDTRSAYSVLDSVLSAAERFLREQTEGGGWFYKVMQAIIFNYKQSDTFVSSDEKRGDDGISRLSVSGTYLLAADSVGTARYRCTELGCTASICSQKKEPPIVVDQRVVPVDGLGVLRPREQADHQPHDHDDQGAKHGVVVVRDPVQHERLFGVRQPLRDGVPGDDVGHEHAQDEEAELRAASDAAERVGDLQNAAQALHHEHERHAQHADQQRQPLDDERGLELGRGARAPRQPVHQEVLVDGARQRVEPRGHGAVGEREAISVDKLSDATHHYDAHGDDDEGGSDQHHELQGVRPHHGLESALRSSVQTEDVNCSLKKTGTNHLMTATQTSTADRLSAAYCDPYVYISAGTPSIVMPDTLLEAGEAHRDGVQQR